MTFVDRRKSQEETKVLRRKSDWPEIIPPQIPPNDHKEDDVSIADSVLTAFKKVFPESKIGHLQMSVIVDLVLERIRGVQDIQ